MDAMAAARQTASGCSGVAGVGVAGGPRLSETGFSTAVAMSLAAGACIHTSGQKQDFDYVARGEGRCSAASEAHGDTARASSRNRTVVGTDSSDHTGHRIASRGITDAFREDAPAFQSCQRAHCDLKRQPDSNKPGCTDKMLLSPSVNGIEPSVLPAAARPAAPYADALASAPACRASEALGPRSCRVLLVAGPGVPSTALASQLRTAGYPVASAAELGGVRVAQARALAAGKPFHLLLICAAGPPPSALLALCSSLSALSPPLPAVVVAGQGGAPPAVVSAALQAGAQDVLEAPLSSKEVNSLWKHVCKASFSRKRNMNNSGPLYSHAGINCLPGSTTKVDIAEMEGVASLADVPDDSAAALALAHTVPQPSCGTSGRGVSCQPNQTLLLQWLCQIARQGETGRAQGLATFYQILLYTDRYHRQTGKPMGMALLQSTFVNREGHLAICLDAGDAAGPSGSTESLGCTDKDLAPCSHQTEAKSLSGHLMLFVAPEGPTASPASDLYSLGCLLFVLCHGFNPDADVHEVMSELRLRILPDAFLDCHPVEATLILRLLHPKPESRPSAAQVGCSPVFKAARESLQATKVAIPGSVFPCTSHCSTDLQRAAAVMELAHEFLLGMHKSLRHSHQSNCKQMAVMEEDLVAVLGTIDNLHAERDRHAMEAGTLRKRRRTAPEGALESPLQTAVHDLLSPPCRQKETVIVKQGDLDMYSCLDTEDDFTDTISVQEDGEISEATARSEPGSTSQDNDVVSDKWSRLHSQLPVMQNLYLKRFQEQQNGTSTPPPSSCSQADGELIAMPRHLVTFSQDLGNFSRYGRLEHHASLIQADGSNASNQMICSMSFGCNDEMFATAGTVTKKIKLYQVQPLLQHSAGGYQHRRSSAAHYPVLELEAQEKLSCIAWNQYMRSYLVSADHGGSLHLWDTAKGEVITSFEEHNNRRVWSVDFSLLDPRRMLSAAEDGTLKLWSTSEPCSTSSLCAPAPAYSAQFSPSNSNHVALGCANYRAYVYDLRNTVAPLVEVAGHRKAVSYVRFMGGSQLVTASIDSTVQLWDLNNAYQGGQPSNSCVFRSHVNEKRFVGLAVREDGYILCGSENDQVCCYYSGLPVPILRHEFKEPMTGAGCNSAASSVAWSGTSNLFLAANTSGSVDLMEMTTC